MKWTMECVMDLATAYWRSAAFSAAADVGLFGALEAGPATAAAVAAAASLPERHAGELMNALAAIGVLIRRGDAFEIEPSLRPFVTRAGPSCLLDALRFNADLYPLWGRLADSVRNGRPALPPSAHLGHDPERTRRFVLGMHSRAAGLAPALLPAVDLRAERTLLDVGSGPGTFSRRLAEAHADLRVVQFDLPPVLAVAKELTEDSPAAARIVFQPGDYRDPAGDFGAAYDAVLYCGALHQESPESAAALFGRLGRAVNPGGRLIAIDMMLQDGQPEPAFAALFSLNMMLTSPFGRVFETGAVQRLMEEAGFSGVSCRPIERIPYFIVEGRKRA